MPDAWENEIGLNPNDPEDRNDDRNNDGYTNLEEYLYSLVPSDSCDIYPGTFLLVTGGSGSGAYDSGAVVNISADEHEDNWVFTGWTGDVSFLADPGASSTTVSMPEGLVERWFHRRLDFGEAVTRMRSVMSSLTNVT